MKNFLIEEADFPTPELQGSLPQYFTNPFSYEPHPLCVKAAHCVEAKLYSVPGKALESFWKEGKMFGVLVAESSEGRIGYLAAHSGAIGHELLKSFFVPPVYDLLSPDSFFPDEEHEISMINELILALQSDREFHNFIEGTIQVKEYHHAEIERLKDIYLKGKIEREKLRESVGKEKEMLQARLQTGLEGFEEELEIRRALEELEATLGRIVRESQFQKGEIRRAEKRMKEELGERLEMEQGTYRRIEELKQLRKQKSIALQKKIFSHFSFLNAYGEQKSLLDIFGNNVPPAGAGECAAPRLLQYAYQHGYRPIAMGEFWFGGTNPSRLRVDGKFYPSCKEKCGPILGFMLQGLKVNPENFHTGYGCEPSLAVNGVEVLYEDETILAVNKPAGILSVPGKDSSEHHLAEFLDCCQPDWRPVHRLDMHTSGVLLLAKDESAYKALQKQFLHRGVEKVYHAVLDGEVSPGTSGDCVVWTSDVTGEISIPLSPDHINRPLQMADFEGGKPAFTKFRILRREKGRTYIEFNPVTGRTHQLRVHSAHRRGLGAPIVGDLLYGRIASRLMLHASSVKFVRPDGGQNDPDVTAVSRPENERQGGVHPGVSRPKNLHRESVQPEVPRPENKHPEDLQLEIVAPHPESFRWIEG